MKKLSISLFIFLFASSINCMDYQSHSKKEKSITIELTKQQHAHKSSELKYLKTILPQQIVTNIEKIEQWPDWAKQTTGCVLSSAYMVSLLYYFS